MTTVVDSPDATAPQLAPLATPDVLVIDDIKNGERDAVVVALETDHETTVDFATNNDAHPAAAASLYHHSETILSATATATTAGTEHETTCPNHHGHTFHTTTTIAMDHYTGGTTADSRVASGNELNDDYRKRGQTFCGCCCDMRRAVIIIGAMHVMWAVVFAIAISIQWLSTGFAEIDAALYMWSYAWAALHVMAFYISIKGAIHLEPCLIRIGMVPLTIDLVLGVVSTVGSAGRQFGIGWMAALWMYPHLVLIREIRQGIMTNELYILRERYSCCCV